MILNDLFRNYVNALVGKNQEFENLLHAKDVNSAKDRMVFRQDEVMEAMKEFDTRSHLVMKREDKIVTDKQGRIVRKEPVWKLPIPYPVFINEVALVFLYARPVRWVQNSEDTDEAFRAYNDFIKSTRFDSKIRQCKRYAGSETESAMLFRVFKNDDGRADCQIRVLARSKGDEIYTRFDQYENLTAFAWGYYAKDEEETAVYHWDCYTAKTVYHCTKKPLGWDVVEERNAVGKIPVIYFRQEKEWAGVESLIHREEFIVSRTADTNDYFSDPIAVMNADIIKNMPEKKEAAKVLVTNSQDGVNNAVKYLTWDSAPESKRQELEWLQTQILQKTFTPNITTDTLKSVSQLSAKALRTVMLLADIKAAKRKETHDELLDRTSTLIASIIGNVLDVSLAEQCGRLKVAHEYQEPFGEDIAESINNIIRSVDAGILSVETAVALNPLVKDSVGELGRIREKEEEMQKRQEMMFATANGDEGAQSATDEDEE